MGGEQSYLLLRLFTVNHTITGQRCHRSCGAPFVDFVTRSHSRLGSSYAVIDIVCHDYDRQCEVLLSIVLYCGSLIRITLRHNYKRFSEAYSSARTSSTSLQTV